MQNNPILDEIRQIRAEIEEECDHDFDKIFAEAMKIQEEVADRLVVKPGKDKDVSSTLVNGHREPTSKHAFSLPLSAEDAMIKVNYWLLMDVDVMIDAGEPVLALNRDEVVWRVPAIFTVPETGTVNKVGQVDVDVKTGEMLNIPVLRAEIAQTARALTNHVT